MRLIVENENLEFNSAMDASVPARLLRPSHPA